MTGRICNVCFTPESGHQSDIAPGPLCARRHIESFFFTHEPAFAAQKTGLKLSLEGPTRATHRQHHMKPCEICGSQAKELGQDWAREGRECPRCGQYGIDTVSDGLRPNVKWFSEAEAEKMATLSGYAREQNAVNSVPTLTRALIQQIVSRPRPDLRTRALILLRELGRSELSKAPVIGVGTIALEPRYAGFSYSVGGKEIEILLRV
jgi:hypothetical protein